ncbi:2-keto-3-deoxygalactonate kinase [Stenotrophomonas rhizophila]|uniref:2-dehydro-3-deoxygalactonokinase n=1 Tax=Stenotrophomonas rhizophila TaxID=216778 RepID=UPI000F4B32B1|nr:2-dehydro-3-deoxygalactonokinase [Stenotrophomonas rhizophila]ROP79798.1 2-keto-3-deoxygalactonate kinase [Stenotrophomonas rhizophila]
MIAVDWGSSSLRGYWLDAHGAILDERASARGILHCDGDFAGVLAELVQGWPGGTVLLSGMIGSRNGWVEQAYLPCPASLADLAAALQPHSVEQLPDHALWFVPGVAVQSAGDTPDVMRGEETQLFGLDSSAGPAQVCLPGTHSKWATLHQGAITGFATAMTGELFALLRQHSLLGRLMDHGDSVDATAFAQGVQRSGDAGGLLHHLFGVRALGLFERLSPLAAPSYLSGVLLGHEIRALADASAKVHLVGSAALTARYGHALQLLGITPVNAPENLAARGLYRLARQRGLLD